MALFQCLHKYTHASYLSMQTFVEWECLETAIQYNSILLE